MKTLWILSCAEPEAGGGVWRVALSPEGTLTPLACLPLPKPMYAALGGGRLHVLLRAPFADRKTSGCVSCRPDFTDLTAPADTLGVCGCHLAVSGGDVYVANYLSGNLVKNGSCVVTHTGVGTNLPRQDQPHTHFVCLSPDGAYVLCCDLGLDTVFVYDRDLHPVSRAAVPAGYGVRHLVFAPGGRYFWAVNELIPSVSTFSWESGRAVCLRTDLLPRYGGGNPTAAAIRLDADDDRLYVSVRGEDRLFAFRTHGADLLPDGDFSCGGRCPRDFAICGGYLVSTNENSDTVTVLDKQNGSVRDTLPLRSPLCVLEELV